MLSISLAVLPIQVLIELKWPINPHIFAPAFASAGNIQRSVPGLLDEMASTRRADT
jgi:hypothetical protein